MDIYLRQFDNPNDFIKFPVIPKGVNCNSEQKIETFETLSIGDLKLLGVMGNRTLTLSSFFPNKDYPFLRDRTYTGMEYIDKIQAWRASKKPLKINISDLNIVMNCVIESLDFAIQDGSGDIYYNLSVEEYKMPQINKAKLKERLVRINTVPVTQITTPKSSYVKKKKSKPKVKVYSGPAIGYDLLAEIDKDVKVKILGKEGEFIKIKHKNQVAYSPATGFTGA